LVSITIFIKICNLQTSFYKTLLCTHGLMVKVGLPIFVIKPSHWKTDVCLVLDLGNVFYIICCLVVGWLQVMKWEECGRNWLFILWYSPIVARSRRGKPQDCQVSWSVGWEWTKISQTRRSCDHLIVTFYVYCEPGIVVMEKNNW
jgi:hypothetical protein